MYESTRLWLLNDRQRYRVPQIKVMFFEARDEPGLWDE